MTPKHLFILLMAIVATGSITGQNNEGSGEDTLIEPQPAKKSNNSTILHKDVILSSKDNADEVVAPTDQLQCPAKCVCEPAEGGSTSYVVDCSGRKLTEFPAPLDLRTTTLNIQNNKLTEIPKSVSLLKNLQVLNAENNFIKHLVPGSVSELERLKVLKLSYNLIREYPLDLKNSFKLTKLEELEFGINMIGTELKPELFTIFKSLKSLTIPFFVPKRWSFIENVCRSLKESIKKVCIDTCRLHKKCPDSSKKFERYFNFGLGSHDTSYSNIKRKDEADIDTEESPKQTNGTGAETQVTEIEATDENITLPNSLENIASCSAKKVKASSIHKNSILVEQTSNDETNANNTNAVAKVGATTDANTRGVNKYKIWFIVAGMRLVVAGITVKKNWSSIKKQLGSSPRPNEYTATPALKPTAHPTRSFFCRSRILCRS